MASNHCCIRIYSVRDATLIAASLIAAMLSAPAWAEIRYDAKDKIFHLTGGGSKYVIGVDENGNLRPLYWGKILDAAAPMTLPLPPPPPVISSMDLPSSMTAQEYAGQGGGIVAEPGIKVAFPDGNLDLVLTYRSHRIVGDTLTIELADISPPLTASLRYTVDPSTGVIERSATARNGGNGPTIDTPCVAGDTWQAVLFHVLQNFKGRDNLPTIQLHGIDSDRQYSVRIVGGGELPPGVSAVAMGSWWMSQGVTLLLRGDFRRLALVLEG